MFQPKSFSKPDENELLKTLFNHNRLMIHTKNFFRGKKCSFTVQFYLYFWLWYNFCIFHSWDLWVLCIFWEICRCKLSWVPIIFLILLCNMNKFSQSIKWLGESFFLVNQRWMKMRVKWVKIRVKWLKI